MTTVIASFVAIVLFGMILLGTINYGDALGYDNTPHGLEISQRLQSAAETVARIQHDTGSRPTSVSELRAGGLPDPFVSDGSQFQIQCDDQRCSPIALCIVLPSTPENIASVKSAATRIKGHFSGACGDTTAPITNEAVASMSI